MSFTIVWRGSPRCLSSLPRRSYFLAIFWQPAQNRNRQRSHPRCCRRGRPTLTEKMVLVVADSGGTKVDAKRSTARRALLFVLGTLLTVACGHQELRQSEGK